MKNKKKTLHFILIALLLCLVSMTFSGLIQNNFGKVKIVDVTLQTDSGTLTGYLLIPQTATAATPAPAVVTSHGYLNNRQMQDITYVELSRRGFVVFAMDAYKHGNSSVPTDIGSNQISLRTGGMVDVVEYLSELAFVDAQHIGVTGHSMGGGFADQTMAYYSNLEKEALASGSSAAEAKKLNKVAAGLIVGNVPSGLEGGTDIMGNQQQSNAPYLTDIGVIVGRYDEFVIAGTGGSVVDLLTQERIKNMVAMQTEDIAIKSAAEVVEGQVYRNAQTGNTIQFYVPWEIHPWNHFSLVSADHTVTFFDQTLSAPNPIPGSNQTWWLKETFNLLGLIGFFLLLVPLADLLLTIPFFKSLRADSVAPVPALETKKAKSRFWTWGFIGAVLVGVVLIPLMVFGMQLVNPFWPQDTTSPIGVWALGSGLLALLILRIAGGKWKDRKETFGVKISRANLGKTILLALSLVAFVYVTVFTADYLFKTDFRIWSFAVKAFPANKIAVALKYLPFFLTFTIINSLSVNRNRFVNWKERKQIWVSILFNILGVVIIIALQYIPCLITGATFFGPMGGMLAGAMALVPILLFPFVPILAIAAVIGIKMYKLTGNIYLGGLVNGLIITMLTIANTSFTYPY